ncbi:Serine/threonine-protein phosphatase T [Neolecta irregularis DAH-3]|uniref:protein-serine/threonine phosphatase n=1 Tax=Neolecta irregularis (strain DAH-3) TaxID=1198029 RepID=A0A1U7LH71_NEOID|nr:Serine/threonine-protein phosphatase T [Neolecta irregularis DAH-3]|eukprot:OLL21994.1 Serine/threonine-protein phosphatase T [Neolecta irregularis DAH-3]
MTPNNTAQEQKNKGNICLAQGDYSHAIKHYTLAIDLEPTAIFYANRAQAHIKMESHGLAIQDATMAIELDPDYIKAYYRRALAYASSLRPKDALVDYLAVVKKAPHDKNAKIKLDECRKFIRRLEFERAIQVEDPPLPSQDIDLDKMTVDEGYNGAKLGDEMTLEFIQDMIDRFKNGKRLAVKYVYQIILAARNIFFNEPTLVEVSVPQDHLFTVCGDTHGQFFDLLEIFRKNGHPSVQHSYLFNGDFVDRGSWSTEIALLLYAYKWLYPQNLLINRGAQ